MTRYQIVKEIAHLQNEINQLLKGKRIHAYIKRPYQLCWVRSNSVTTFQWCDNLEELRLSINIVNNTIKSL